jgi:hypothetical protein
MPHPTQVVSGLEVAGNDGGDHYCGDRSSAVTGFGAGVLAEAKELDSEDLRVTGKLTGMLARPFGRCSHAGDELGRRRFGYEENQRLRVRGRRERERLDAAAYSAAHGGPGGV